MKKTVAEIVTEQFLTALEAGTIPWEKPWQTFRQRNLVTHKLRGGYRGINTLLTAVSAMANGFQSSWWLTFNQIKKKGGTIRPGQARNAGGPGPTVVVFWKILEREDKATGEKKSYPLMRYYNVWNLDQVDGIEAPEVEVREHTPIEAAENVIESMPKRPKIQHGGDRAYYTPALDTVTSPPADTFRSAEDYYATMFHELGHSTGHKSRLDRDMEFHGEKYAKEELVAELTASFIMAHTGIESPDRFDNAAAYIQGWKSRLQDDPRLIISASQAAQKASDFILDNAPSKGGAAREKA